METFCSCYGLSVVCRQAINWTRDYLLSTEPQVQTTVTFHKRIKIFLSRKYYSDLFRPTYKKYDIILFCILIFFDQHIKTWQIFCTTVFFPDLWPYYWIYQCGVITHCALVTSYDVIYLGPYQVIDWCLIAPNHHLILCKRLPVEPRETNSGEMLIKTRWTSFKNIHLKISSAEARPFYSNHNVLIA